MLIFVTVQGIVYLNVFVYQAHSALSAEEEAIALSTWAVACICGSLRLENVCACWTSYFSETNFLIYVPFTIGSCWREFGLFLS